MAVFDQPQTVGDHRQKVHVVADEDHGARVGGQRVNERFAAFDIEVVGRLVEDQQVRRRQGGQQERQTRFLPTRQAAHFGVCLIGAKAETCKTGAQSGLTFGGAFAHEVLQRCFVDEQLIHLVLGKEADAQLVGCDHAAVCDLQAVREHFRQGRFAFAVAAQAARCGRLGRCAGSDRAG